MPAALKSDSRSGVKAVDSTLDVLELLAAEAQPVGVSEVAERLGISAPGAHRMLAALRERGYAEQDPRSSRYSIGLRAFGLATLSASRRDLREKALPHIRELNEATGETVHLAVHDGDSVIYLEKAESRHPVAPVSRIGDRAPAHLVATGRAILAWLPESGLDSKIVDETRRNGWALNLDSWREGVSGVAAPIRDWTGVVVASVGCCLPSRRLTDETRPLIVEHSVAAAARISAELGFVSS
jgi:DNA-binding IclR family transcriptional regulator